MIGISAVVLLNFKIQKISVGKNSNSARYSSPDHPACEPSMPPLDQGETNFKIQINTLCLFPLQISRSRVPNLFRWGAQPFPFN